MAQRTDYPIRSRADIENLKRRRDRIRLGWAMVGVALLGFMCLLNVLCKMIFKESLFGYLDSPLRWIILGSFGVAGLLAYSLFLDGTKLEARNMAILRACLIVDAFEKAEKKLILALSSGSFQPAKDAVEKLENLQEPLQEMKEYQELLNKGRKWLSDHCAQGD